MPTDHEYFQSINTAQWYWYLYNVVQDQEEEFKSKRNFIEYLASFIEPEAVSRIRKQRNDADANAKKDDNFTNTLKNLFGRGAGFDNKPNFSETHEVKDILQRIDEYDSFKQVKSTTAYNYADWINFPLE